MANNDDFDIDDFDLDRDSSGSWGDIDSFSTNGRGDRNPVTRFSMRVLAGASESAKDLNNQLRILKRALPPEYHGALDLIDSGTSAATTMYGKTLEKLRPVSSDVKEFARGISPSINKLLPSKLRGKFQDWLDTNDNDYSAGENREETISGDVKEIFALQTQEAFRASSENRRYRAVKDKVDHERHIDQRTILNDVRIGISRLVGYQDSITYKYQKKSLELQYRHFFIAKDTLTAIQKGNEHTLKALEAVTKNTGLPDAIKLHNNELFGLKTKENIIKKIQDRSFGGIGSMVDRMATNLGGMIDNAVGILGMASGQLSMASMGMQMGGQMEGIVGGQLTNSLGAALASKFNSLYGNNRKLRGFGARVNKIATTARGFTDDRAARGSAGFGFINNLLRSNSEDLSVNSRKTDMLRPASYDQQSKNSITHVIPGYLARVLQELTMQRTRTNAPLLNYNPTNGKWESIKATKSGMRVDLKNNSGGSATAMEIKRAMDLIDPTQSLSPSARKALQMRMLKEASEGKAFYAKAYTRKDSYDTGVSREDQAAIIRHMRKNFGVGKKLSLGDNIEFDNKESSVALVTHEMVKYIKPLRAELELQLALGQRDALEQMGFIKNTQEGSAWDMGKILEFLANNHDFNTSATNSGSASSQGINQQQADHLTSTVRSSIASASNSVRNRSFSRSSRNTGNLNRTARSTASRSNGSVVLDRIRANANDSSRRNRTESSAPANLESLRSGRVSRESLTQDLSTVRSAMGRQNQGLSEISGLLNSLRGAVSGGSATDPSLSGIAEQISHIQADIETASTVSNMTDQERKSVIDSLKARVDGVISSLRSERRTRPNAQMGARTSLANTRTYADNNRTSLPDDYSGVGSELTNLTKEILKTNLEIRDASLMSVRLLNEGLKVSGVEITRGGLTRGLRSGLGKIFSGAGGLLGGTMSFYGKTLGALGGAIKGVFGFTGRVLGRATQGVQFEDIYLTGVREPIITARDLRLGILHDSVTGKVIKTIRDIKGAVFKIVDNAPEYLITASDVGKLYTVKGKPVLPRLLHGTMSFYKAMFSPLTALAKVTAWGITGTAKLVFGATDIYVEGEKTPRLLARVLQQGGYFSSITRKPIHSVKDFNGDVVDQHGNVILSVADMSKLVDRNGKPYRTRGEKILGAAGSLVSAPFKAGMWALKTSYKAMTGILKMAGNVGMGLGRMLLGRGMRNIAKGMGYAPLIKRNPDLIIGAHTNEILIMIAEMLNTRMRGTPDSSDANGDGLKDSGWMARINDMRNKVKGRPKKEEGGKLDSIDKSLKKLLNKDSGGGLMGLLSGGGGALKAVSGLLGGKLGKLLAMGGLAGGLTHMLGGDTNTTMAATAVGGLAGGKILGGAGKLLARGAMALAPAALAGSTGLMALLANPVSLTILGGIAIGAGAYYLYKKYTSGTPAFLSLRMAQYGIRIDEKDRVEKILQLEKLLTNKIVFKGTTDAAIRINNREEDEIANIFGIHRDDETGIRNLGMWLNNRFQITFLKHAMLAFNYTGKTDPSLLDSQLTKAQKHDAMRNARIPEDRNNYRTDFTPFNSPLSTGFAETENVYNSMVEAIDKGNDSGKTSEVSKTDKPAGVMRHTGRGAVPAGVMPADANKAQLSKGTAESAPGSGGVVSFFNKQKSINKVVTADTNRLNAARNASIRAAVEPTAATKGMGGSNVRQFKPNAVPTPSTVGPMGMPVNGPITSPFGPRIAPVSGASINHKGIDIGARQGTPIKAFAAGTIVVRGAQKGYGNVVYLKHADGTTTIYGHMHHFQPDQKLGQFVRAGEIIGYVGSTGHSSGNHLHFEIKRPDGVSIDPLKVLKDKESQLMLANVKKEEKAAKANDGGSGINPEIDGVNTIASTATGKPTEAHRNTNSSSAILSKSNTAAAPKRATNNTLPLNRSTTSTRVASTIEAQKAEQVTKAERAPKPQPMKDSDSLKQTAILSESLNVHRAVHQKLCEISDKLTADKPAVASSTASVVKGNRPYQVDDSPNPVSMRRQS